MICSIEVEIEKTLNECYDMYIGTYDKASRLRLFHLVPSAPY